MKKINAHHVKRVYTVLFSGTKKTNVLNARLVLNSNKKVKVFVYHVRLEGINLRIRVVELKMELGT